MLSKLKGVFKYIFNSDYRFLIVSNNTHKYDFWDDEKFLKRKFRAALGKELSLDNPQTFNEKLQWLKLYDRKSEYTMMVDKYLVKSFIAEKIGDGYIIPTLGVWDSPEEIDFSKLPDKFVLKCNHNSGTGMYICKNKSVIDKEKIISELNKGLAEDYYLSGREWPYKNVERKVIAEQYLTDDNNGLTDYKVHVFNGVPKFILVCKDRFSSTGLTEDFYSADWQLMDVRRPNHPNSEFPVKRPEALDEILELSVKLSQGIPFVRVDFYIVKGKIYFSELTFYPASGFEAYVPEKWDETFGSWLQLPDVDLLRS